MNLQQAKKVKVGDKLVLKETGQILTVSNAVFLMAGKRYATDAVQFSFVETDNLYCHQKLSVTN